jgi:hypothetical protein
MLIGLASAIKSQGWVVSPVASWKRNTNIDISIRGEKKTEKQPPRG